MADCALTRRMCLTSKSQWRGLTSPPSQQCLHLCWATIINSIFRTRHHRDARTAAGCKLQNRRVQSRQLCSASYGVSTSLHMCTCAYQSCMLRLQESSCRAYKEVLVVEDERPARGLSPGLQQGTEVLHAGQQLLLQLLGLDGAVQVASGIPPLPSQAIFQPCMRLSLMGLSVPAGQALPRTFHKEPVAPSLPRQQVMSPRWQLSCHISEAQPPSMQHTCQDNPAMSE